jgi:YD repeat-containing protein
MPAPGRMRGGSSSDRMNIKEEISDKYKERYLAWKQEFLSTEIGRNQWDAFAQREHFTLVITVKNDERNGAGTSKYEWNEAGELVSATISLGTRIDEGYPNPIYYPVMSSLAYSEPSLLNGNILAAAKIAHEFGHVRQASVISGELYQTQNRLIPEYNKILLSNGRNTDDPRLVQLAEQMGGTPVQIWEDREYWGEVNAMLFLRDRITKKSDQHALFARIIRNVEAYAGDYAKRFDQVAER